MRMLTHFTKIGGCQEDVLKKAKKRIVTSTAMSRGIAGLSIEDLKAKKSENPERRKALREATVRYFLPLLCSESVCDSQLLTAGYSVRECMLAR